MKKTILVGSLFVLSGCSMFGSDKPYPLVETSPYVVKDCRKVGTFPGPTGSRMWGPPAVLADFKSQTALKAKEMGATHIYWREKLEGLDGQIYGYAFDCTGVVTERNVEDN
jgi:hypothetical protein